MPDESTEGLEERVNRLEIAVRELRAQRTAPGGPTRASDEAAAHDTLDGVTAALQVLSRHTNAPLLFFASGTARWAAASGPERLDAVTQDEHLPSVVALAEVFVDSDRVKILQTLVVETGCSMTRLAGVSGEPEPVVRTHLEVLHAAGLVFEPSPQNYQLTTVGEQVVMMVFWGAWRASVGAPPELRQDTWTPSR
jgi:hypothetical protein